MSDLPIKATLKAGAGYDAPWLTVDANDPDDLTFKLNAIANGGAPQALIEAANALKAANNAAPLLQHSEPPAQQQAAPAQNAWGQAPQQQAQPAQQQGFTRGATTHPEGESCPCGSVLEYKVVTRKSDQKQFKFWACPNQRSKDDGHRSEFAN